MGLLKILFGKCFVIRCWNRLSKVWIILLFMWVYCCVMCWWLWNVWLVLFFVVVWLWWNGVFFIIRKIFFINIFVKFVKFVLFMMFCCCWVMVCVLVLFRMLMMKCSLLSCIRWVNWLKLFGNMMCRWWLKV